MKAIEEVIKPIHFVKQNSPIHSLKLTKKSEPHNNYKMVEGVLTLSGRQPDGDSVAFKSKNPNAFLDVYRGYLLKPSVRDGSVQLRFDGIDSPELHYGSSLQPLGIEARDFLLKNILGFKKVSFKKSHNPDHPDTSVESSNPETLNAFVATNGLEPHGRPISFVFLEGNFRDGDMVSIDAGMLKTSVNFKMVEAGFAYLLAYDSLPRLLRDVLKQEADTARSQNKGIWKFDTTREFILENINSVQGPNEQLIFPKLFRRCVDYFKAVEKGFRGELTDWLQFKGSENDQVRLADNTIVPMASLIFQVNNHLSFQADTNEIIFIEK